VVVHQRLENCTGCRGSHLPQQASPQLHVGSSTHSHSHAPTVGSWEAAIGTSSWVIGVGPSGPGTPADEPAAGILHQVRTSRHAEAGEGRGKGAGQ
jgi:hypothetical protein